MRRASILCFTALIISLGAGTRVRADFLLYGLEPTAGNTNSELVTINTTTGLVTQIGATGTFLVGLAADASGNLFATDGSNTTPTLYRINATSGAATSVGSAGVSTGFINSLTFANGSLYGYSTGNNQLFSFNASTGAATLVLTSVSSLAQVAPSGTNLLALGNPTTTAGSSYTVNLTNNTVSPPTSYTNSTGSTLLLNGMAVGNSGTYLVSGTATIAGTNELLSFNPNTNTLTQIVQFSDGASGNPAINGLASVPEPSTLILTGVGMGLLAARAALQRRRRTGKESPASQ